MHQRDQSDPRYLRFYPWTERDAAAARAFVGGFIARQIDEPRDIFQLPITLPAESGRLIGSCGVRVNDRPRREGNIGYELNPEYWAHGYATEAAWTMLSYGFERLGLHRIWADATRTTPPRYTFWRKSVCDARRTSASATPSRAAGGTA